MQPCPQVSEDEPARPLQRFLQLVMRAMVRDMNDLLRELHLSMPQVGALHFLHAERGTSVSGIAEHLNLSLAATSHLVERLVQRGLVTRAEDPHDRRLKRVELASDGVELVEDIQRRAAAAFDELLEPLPRELRQRFEADVVDVLATLASHDAAPG